MATMEITTVIGCRLRCHYCPQEKLIQAYSRRPEALQYLRFAVFEKILDKIPLAVRIDFSGMAEPWLNAECTKMLLYAAGRGHKISVYSTLVGMPVADVAQIKKVNFEKFVVHLPDEEGYAHFNIDEQYLETLRIISASVSNLFYVSMGTVPGRIEKIIRRYVPKSFFHTRAGNLENGAAVVRTAPILGPLFCQSSGRLLNHNVLLPDGEVVLCCMDYGLRHVLGNLLTNTYDELFIGAEFRKAQNGLENDPTILCRRCIEARQVRKSFVSMWQLYRQFHLFFKIKSIIKRFYKKLKYLF